MVPVPEPAGDGGLDPACDNRGMTAAAPAGTHPAVTHPAGTHEEHR
jgi:hypothetical protein